ncbi:solute carrier family 22 member 7 [Bombina bombina]|uniref:solute carrier family 22 member 7 n=1 Tax=Bombina bombina TaxID=8345 RepID=UPI00235A75E7|nr:solute carrier family 22 member 7 [Bombina bombina]
MRFEDVLAEVGVFGKFQIVSLIILCLPRLILPLHFLLHIFISAVPPHYCATGAMRAIENGSQKSPLYIYIPKEADGSYSSCKMYAQPQTHLMFNRSRQDINSTVVQNCDQGYVFDTSTYTSTTVTQWDLVCEKKGLNQASATFFFIGLTVGSIISGYLSDRFGRRKILLLSFLGSTLFGVMSALSVSFVMFSISRLLCGVGLMGMTLISVTLALEWTDAAHRTFCGTISSLSWTVGYMLLALMAYLIRDWRWLLMAVTSPCLLAIATWWWVPESARWLLTQQETAEAHKYLSQCAKKNGKQDFSQIMSPEALQKLVTVESRRYNFWDLVKTQKLRKNTLCLGIMWFGVSFSYYGISFNVSGFSLSPFLTHFIFGVIEIPAKLSVFLLLDRIGRKLCQGGSLVLTGVFIALTSLTPKEFYNTRSVVAILGKGFSEAAFTTAFLFTAELYPTVLRQTGLGFCSFMTRLGGSVAPLVILLEDVWVHVPPVMYSVIAIISGGVAFLLTETSHLQLPETVLDVEFVRNRSVPVTSTDGDISQGRLKCKTAATHSPIGTDAASDPIGTDAASDPIGTDAASPPIGTDAASPPIGTDASDPIGTDAASDPIGTDAASDPIGTDAVSDPIGTEAVNDPIGTEAVNDPTAGCLCNTRYVHQPEGPLTAEDTPVGNASTNDALKTESQ